MLGERGDIPCMYDRPRSIQCDYFEDVLLVALQTGRTITGNYTVTYNVPANKLVIGTLDGAATFHVYSGAWLKTNAATWNTHYFAGGGPTIDANSLVHAGSVTGFGTGASILTGNVSTSVSAPDVVNTQPYHQLVLRSSLGNSYDAIGPDGSSDICRRIVCQVPLNDIIIDQHGLPHDSVTFENKQISSLNFTLTDCFGKVVDTKGHHIFFSIISLENKSIICRFHSNL